MREAALGEQYDAGVVALQQANDRVAAAAKALASAKTSQRKTVVLLRQDAVQAYVGGGPALELAGPVALANLNQALLRQELEQTFASHEIRRTGQLPVRSGRGEHGSGWVGPGPGTRTAGGWPSLESDRQQVMATQNKLVGVQQQVKGQIATLVARNPARRAAGRATSRRRPAGQQRQAEAGGRGSGGGPGRGSGGGPAGSRGRGPPAATTTASSRAAGGRDPAGSQPYQLIPSPVASVTTTTVPVESTPVPSESSAAAAAVAAAESRVGDPYVWGAAGPSAFDCSGLVMWAYEQAGISLPHYSGAQFSDTTQIPMSDLQPGDLVFPANPGEHVAMYIGNGDIVQAPYTGADVQIVPLSSFFVLATRVG